MWQYHYLTKSTTVTSGTTESPIDLGKIYPISAVIVTWEFATGTGGSVQMADDATLEIKKDGVEVITSGQFGELVAAQQLLRPRTYQIADMGESAGPTYYAVVLHFGRYIGDNEYFLDPRGWASLDLVIKQPTIAETTLAVYNVIVVRAVPPISGSHGFFKTSTKKAYTSGAAHEYVDLDRRHRYGAIWVGEMDGTSTDITSVVSEFRVDCDAGVFVPLDLKISDAVIVDAISRGDPYDNTPNTITADRNFIAANWINPWRGEGMLLDAPSYGKLQLDITGAAAGTLRVGAIELVRPGETP